MEIVLNENDFEMIKLELKSFLNENMQIIKMPVKYKKKLVAAYYLASKFASGKAYTEFEVNEIICAWHTFSDQATFRRLLIDTKLLARTADCSQYRLTDSMPSLIEYISKRI